jgi:serine/threonine-protein kinase RsbW
MLAFADPSGIQAIGTPAHDMTEAPDSRIVKLDVATRFEMLDIVQTVLSQVCTLVGFEEETTDYLAVAVRESVVNAMKHGNRQDESKRVRIQFRLQEGALEVQVEDEGPGFHPEEIPDPLAPENLLKAYGRGIFFMKQFMDEVSYSFPKKGGTVVRMVKRLAA